MDEARKKAAATGLKSELFDKKLDAEEMMRGDVLPHAGAFTHTSSSGSRVLGRRNSV
jgi:hypothetical protein